MALFNKHGETEKTSFHSRIMREWSETRAV